MPHATRDALASAVDLVRQSPADAGTLDFLVRRPEVGEREVLDEGELDTVVGLVGDGWQYRPSKDMADGTANPDKQLNIMNSRALAAICPDRDRWALAGDQLYVDLDLSSENLPAGTRLAVGDAVVEVTASPHNGCAKFADRYGPEATRWVNSPAGKELHLRGVCAKVVTNGTIRVGDTITKLV